LDDAASSISQALTCGEEMPALLDTIFRLANERGRGLHSSTFQLNVSTFWGTQWVVSVVQ